jgi:hypothetical protein
MKKKLYDLTQKKRAEIRVEDYCGIASTKKEAMRMRESADNTIAKLRYQRELNKKNGLVKNFDGKKMYLTKMKHIFVNRLPFSASRYDIHISYGKSFAIKTAATIAGRYSSRCTWTKVDHEIYITIPVGGLRYRMDDGILFLVDHEFPYGLFAGKIFTWKGYNPCYKKAWLYTDDTVSAHGYTAKQAVAAYQLKFVKQHKFDHVTADTVLSAGDYRAITRACIPGIDAWIASHGYRKNVRLAVKDVLPVLKKEDAWGWEKLAEIVK